MDADLLRTYSDEKTREMVDRMSNMFIAKEQKTFLESNLGQIINGAVDIGIKAILPDYIDNQIIEIKDAFLQEGFSEGINMAINKALETGKTIGGIIAGDFKSISQVQDTVRAGELLNKASTVLDNILTRIEEKGHLSTNIINAISAGKDLILGIMNKNLGNNFDDQIKYINNINKHIENWNKSYLQQDFKNMEVEYKHMEQELKKVMPLEQILNKAREIENLHNLIKNKDGDFNLSKYEIELATRLA